MNNIYNHSIKIILGLLFSVILFHICIISKIIPYNIAWGGRLTNDNEMYVFETISIIINVFLSWILLMKGDFVKFKFSENAVKIILWTFFGLFIRTIYSVIGDSFIYICFGLLTIIFVSIYQLRKQDNKVQDQIN